MRRLAAALVFSLGLAACAPTTTTVNGVTTTQTPVQALQSFAVSDLQAALADATAHNDTVAATCYTALIPAVQSLPSLLPTVAPVGGFSAFQATRDAINGVQTGLPSGIKALNVPCAPLVLDAENTVLGIAAKVGLSVGTGGIAGVLPIPLGAKANPSLGGK